MKSSARLPLSEVTLVFGVSSIPLAFLRQLCVPATIVGLLAITFHFWGRAALRKRTFSESSVKRSAWGFKCALLGTVCAVTMWVLWATNVLLR